MILETKVYKYGCFKEVALIEFENEAELLKYIEYGKQHTEFITEMSIECEENCSKWVETFIYKGVDYKHELDC